MTSTTGEPAGSPGTGHDHRRTAAACIVAFPGQGTDAGSTAAVLDRHRRDELVKALVRQYAEAEGRRTDLADLVTTQPAAFVTSTLRARAFRGRPAVVVGHSLGEIAALVFAGAMDPHTGLALVIARGRACREVADRCAGQMVAVLGLTEDGVEAVRQEAVCATGEILDLAAVNAEYQAVLSGTPAAAARAVRLARSSGAYAVALPISGAYHSRLMAPARDRFREALEGAAITTPRLPWRSTIDGRAHTEPAMIRTVLADALVEPVRWRTTLAAAVGNGADVLVDVGPDDVLARLDYAPGVLAMDLDRWTAP